MKKHSKILLFIVVTLLMFNMSCRKETVKEEAIAYSKGTIGKQQTSVKEKQAIQDWIEAHEVKLNNKDKNTLKLFSSKLNYDQINIESRENGEDIIIIPIDKSFKGHLNENATYLKLDDNSILNYMIIRSKTGKLRWSSIVAYLPANGNKQQKVSNYTMQNILNNKPVEDEGMFKFISLTGVLSHQREYKSGKISSAGVNIKKSELAKMRPLSHVKKTKQASFNNAPLPEDCEDYYLVVTYYDGEGGTYEEEQYLYTLCDGETGGGGGGSGENGEPEEENDMEIEFEGSKVVYIPLVSDDYYVSDTDVNSLTAVGVPSQIYFDAYWTGKRMEKKRTILYITQGDIFGYPVSETYSVKGKGRVVRALTWTRGDKGYDLLPPFKSSARLY